MVSDFIVHVDESDFEYEVLQYSTHVPVVVDFWATWCVPCRVLGPRLEDLARKGEGSFRLAKVNVDENARLTRQYKVRNIPAVKAFVDGRLVSEFSGVLEEDQLRDFVRRLAPEPEELIYEKGESLLILGDLAGAEEAFREFLSMRPNHPKALLGLVRALLFQGEGREAQILLKNFPASSSYNTAQLLLPVAKAFSEIESDSFEEIEPLEAAYRNGVRLARRGNVLAAMDGFLNILRKDKHYRGDQVKDVFVGLLALIGDSHPEARQYRNDLSAALF
ncbi:MAG: tetratricopeptide repeat protein [Brevefilum sp.]|nr:tetratricopeptide repeat protein [Brevefilum sp.]MDW7754345.1 tetratricopeptide repeat protein [Brevefilum sp.]